MAQEAKRKPGRPKGSNVKPVEDHFVEVALTMSREEKDFLKQLGGSKWVRAKMAEIRDERSDKEIDAILNEAHLKARRKELAIKRAIEQRRASTGQPVREGRTFKAVCLECSQDFQAPTRVSSLCPQCQLK